MQRIYFDHSATTPVDERVVVAMIEYMLDKFGNPSSIHSFGRDASKSIEDARDSIAALLNCNREEIFFTSGGTEADNLALIGYMTHHENKRRQLIISEIEHPAIRNSAEELKKRGYDVVRIRSDNDGKIELEEIESVISTNTALVSVIHINNEIGTINDIASIAELTHKYGAVFHTDAVQSFGKFPINVEKMSIDMASISAHKIYGPKGVGAIYIREGLKLNSRSFGGQHEMGLRVGTENLPGIVGFGRATQICQTEMDSEAAYLGQLRENLYNTLSEELDDLILNGHPVDRLPGNLNLSFRGVEGEALLLALDLEGIAVSSGSACSSGNTDPSPILLAIGLDPQDAQASLRITLGRSNTQKDVDYAARVIIDVVNRLRTTAGN